MRKDSARDKSKIFTKHAAPGLVLMWLVAWHSIAVRLPLRESGGGWVA